MDVEVCIDSLEQAETAEKFEAKRVELCSALEIGGLTPTAGLTRQCSDLSAIETHVMIRPRGGGFVYTSNEIQTMMYDIQSLHQAGANGVVFGVLDEDKNLDPEGNTKLINLSKLLDLEITFHRAFDYVKDPQKVLDLLIEFGFDRILTSGQQPTAFEGIDLIKSIVKQARGRIQIMAGSGVNSSNVHELTGTGIDAVHFTARKPKSESMDLNMGLEYEVDNDKIRSIINAIN